MRFIPSLAYFGYKHILFVYLQYRDTGLGVLTKMRIYSLSGRNILVILLISITDVCLCKKRDFYTQDNLRFLPGDLQTLGSEEQKSILRSLSMPEDTFVGEESKKSVLIRVNPPKKKKSAPFHGTPINDTDKNYVLHQWYATPSRTVEHHVESGKINSAINTYSKILNDKRDLKAQSTTTYSNHYSDDSHEHHDDDHYHVDHTDHIAHHHDYSGEDENKSHFNYHPTDEENNHDGPSSDIYFKKLKLKKVRRNCTRTKSKKSQGWPDTLGRIASSRTSNLPEMSHYESNTYQGVPEVPHYDSTIYNNGPEMVHYDSKTYNTVPALQKFSDIPKFSDISEASGKATGFSGEYLHGIPRTHFFQYKDGEGINHYHLHNHHHIYTADGKRISLPKEQSYRNLINHFGKLKAMLTSKNSESPHSNTHLTDNYRSTLTLGNINPVQKHGKDDSQKQGYHYTGTHESYGRKTYKRIYPQSKLNSLSSVTDDKSFGMEMFRYGAGQYGTDEFSNENKARYPNEVSLDGDKTYSHSGEIYEPMRNKPNYNTPSSLEYNSDSPSTPYKPYSGKTESNYNTGEKKNIFNLNYEDKAPYVPQTHLRGTTPGAPHNRFLPPSSKRPRQLDSYPAPFNQNDGKSDLNGPSNNIPQEPPGIRNPVPPNIDITHSISYSQDGKIQPMTYGQENPSLFIRPEPDPLTIPRNAKVFEHHIRLHPMHYNLYSGVGKTPLSYPTPYSTPTYTVPLHKIISNPMKLPLVPIAPATYPNPYLNQMLRAYQSRSLHLGGNRLW